MPALAATLGAALGAGGANVSSFLNVVAAAAGVSPASLSLAVSNVAVGDVVGAPAPGAGAGAGGPGIALIAGAAGGGAVLLWAAGLRVARSRAAARAAQARAKPFVDASAAPTVGVDIGDADDAIAISNPMHRRAPAEAEAPGRPG
jgi:hypothetical protein